MSALLLFTGRDGAVTADCREQLSYVDAFLHEVLRIKTVAPMGLFHETNKDIELGEILTNCFI